ncbi:recombinase family protein [Aquibacillus koreensis]|uniref:Recombinase family protein n=1 Tax=Aquibacillus koreensis TaxID=279446 RepID=A0A9X3WGK2_9BACI|nr:recombinase family protein [Aquibacillus koreensis]MCT2536552.1 recombinase family protein [Aquibacillus koreensis]MDC3419360.1 recombinase family protein [Aquibacillus koreensis]
MLKPLRTAVGYIRTASLELNTEDIVQLRKEDIATYCTKQGILIEEIIEDRGSSGLSPLISRVGGGTLIDYIIKGEADCIIVHHLYELSRDSEELLSFLKIINEKEITLIDLSVLNSKCLNLKMNGEVCQVKNLTTLYNEGGIVLDNKMNSYHIGEITGSFGINVAGLDVWFDEGELVYVLAEIFDEEDSDCILWYAIMQPVSKDVIRINSDFIKVKSRGNVMRFPHYSGE